MKFGAYLYSIYPGSVLGGHFWGNTMCLADFGLVRGSSLKRTIRMYHWNIQNNSILEFSA